MSFKVGDKVVFTVKKVEPDGGVIMKSGNDTLYIVSDIAKTLEKLDMTAEEAWEIARRIEMSVEDGGMDSNELKNCFGYWNCFDIFREISVLSARDKIRAWEESKEIKVGDVVKVENGYEFVVTHISGGTHLFGITAKGDTYTAVHRSKCTKTGKHIDIQSILDQIGGGEE